MQVLVCDSAITLNASGFPECATGWLVADPASFKSGLSIDDFDYLAGWTFFIFALAFGAKLIRKTIEENSNAEK